MEEIWMRACTHYDVPEDVGKAWYGRIHQRLSQTEPTRACHNWQEMMLRKQGLLQHCKPSVVLAAFFQYYEFDGNRSCVQENCAAFEEFCRDALWEDEQSKCLILKLLGHKSVEAELTNGYEDEANLLQDIDLAVLASPPQDYNTYTQLLRREYAKLGDEHYKLMRLKVLETLLMIPNIFSTPQYQTKFEEAARQNIRQEINQLKS